MPGAGDVERLLPLGHEGHAAEVSAHSEDEGLAGDADGLDRTRLGPLAQPRDHCVEPGDGRRPEGIGLGVIKAVVQGDQRQRPRTAGQVDVLHQRLGDDLVRERRLCGCGQGLGHGSGLLPARRIGKGSEVLAFPGFGERSEVLAFTGGLGGEALPVSPFGDGVVRT